MKYDFGGRDSRFGDMIGTTQAGGPIAVYRPAQCDARFPYGAGSSLLIARTGVHRIATPSR